MRVHTWGILAVVSLVAAQPDLHAQSLKERITLKEHSQAVTGLAFSPDSKVLATTSEGHDSATDKRYAELRFWEVASGKELLFLKCQPGSIERMCFSPDGKMLATAGRLLKVWDVVTDKERVTLKERTTFKAEFSSIGGMAFNLDGKKLGAADYQYARVFDVEKEREISSLRPPVAGWSSTFGPDLATLASPNYQDVDLWDIDKGKLRTALLDHRGLVAHSAFTADGTTLVVVSQRLGDNRKLYIQVKIWDAATGKERATLKEFQACLQYVALKSDGNTLALVTSQREQERPSELKLLLLPADRVLDTISYKGKKDTPASLMFSPDGKLLAAGCADGSVKVWDFVQPTESDPKK
jgi:WD40 repeat protein